MTYEEIEKTLAKIAETQLVHAKLILDNERQWREQMSDLREIVKHHEDRLAASEGGIARMESAMEKLFERMDRFIQGLEREDGHK
jgi:hypothetical protein